MTDRSISVELHIGDDANPSPRLASALSELASALAAEEVARHVEPPSNDDVIGFAMPSLTVGDLGLNPGGSMGICFGNTKQAASPKTARRWFMPLPRPASQN